jgi:hypothetical protein
MASLTLKDSGSEPGLILHTSAPSQSKLNTPNSGLNSPLSVEALSMSTTSPPGGDLRSRTFHADLDAELHANENA